MSDDYNSSFDSLFSGDGDDAYLTRRQAREEVTKALSDIAKFSSQAQAGVRHGLEEVSRHFPDFEQRRPEMQVVLEGEPLLRQAITSAENNPDLADTLPALYGITYKLSQVPQDSGKPNSEARVETPRPSDLTDELVYLATQQSKSVDLSKANRQHLIESLEAKGVLDVEF
jgi:hypothetical protein